MTKEITKKQEDIEEFVEDIPSHKVILYNDDYNTFDWVIESLVDVCEHDPVQAEQCAVIVHFKGKANVKSGELEDMQGICQALCDRDLSAVLE